jgi:hypothetical protein
MTDRELEGLAAQALNMARLEIERGNGFGFLLATCHDGRTLYRMERVEQLIAERLGEDWLDHGRKKDRAFGLLRMAVDHIPVKPDAIVIVTAGDQFWPTGKFHALDPETQKKLATNSTPAERRRHAAEGLYTVRDVLQALAQSPERVCIRWQPVDERGRFIDSPRTELFDQENFGGRIKMFGEDQIMTGEHDSIAGVPQ